MAKSKKSVAQETTALQDLMGFGAGILDVSGSILSGTSKVIRQISGKTVEVNHVVELLNELQIKPSQCKSEKHIETIIAAYLDQFYDVHRQYNIGGFLGLKIDIDVNQTVGIELKLASELVGNPPSASAIERLLGQTLYYSHRKYKKKLIVLLVGTAKDSSSRVTEELQEIIESLGGCFYYLKLAPRG